MNWADFTIAAASPAGWGAFWSIARYRRIDRRYTLWIWLAVAAGDAVFDSVFIVTGISRLPFLYASPSGVTGHLVSAAIAVILLWWNSGQRKRAAKLAGNKARAIRDAMARKMPAPRKLAPVPG